MPGFVITSDQLMWFCTFAAGLWGLWKIVKEIRKPNDDLKMEVSKHAEFLDNDNRRLKEVEHSNQMILRSLLVIINHEITGNGIENMKKTRDEIQEFLINR